MKILFYDPIDKMLIMGENNEIVSYTIAGTLIKGSKDDIGKQEKILIDDFDECTHVFN